MAWLSCDFFYFLTYILMDKFVLALLTLLFYINIYLNIKISRFWSLEIAQEKTKDKCIKRPL